MDDCCPNTGCDLRAALLEGDDGMGVYVFDPDGINLNLKVINDAEREETPLIIVEILGNS